MSELNSKLLPNSNELRIFELLQGTTRLRPVDIRTLKAQTNLCERTIKAAIHELIVAHKVMIGAARHRPCGYYLIRSEQDVDAASAPIRGQIIQMLRRLRCLESPARIREFLGQQVADL